MSEVKRELYRKLVHLLLSLVLAVPYIFPLPPPLHIYSYYAVGLFFAALLNSIVVKRSVFLDRLAGFREVFNQQITGMRELQRKGLFKALEEAFIGLVEFVEQQVDLLERDYERREGYVGLLYGIVGAVVALLVSPCHLLYGLLALAVVDPVASLLNLLLRARKSAVGDIAASMLYTVTLLLLGVPLAVALPMALVASLTEYVSVEDNLTIPPVTTLAALLLGAPSRCPL